MYRIGRLTLTSEVPENPLDRRLLLAAGDHPQLSAEAPAGKSQCRWQRL
jgi:hypothetical protein